MSYLLLAGAIISEVIATTSLKLSNGFSRPWFIPIIVVGYGLSFYLLALTLKSMSIGTAYAIWSAVGTAIIVVLGIVVFHETLTWVKMLGIALVITGVVLLNVQGDH